eukprot:COSAG04_NODE_5609_length_1553_cov_1.522696_1_plen_436_part_01
MGKEDEVLLPPGCRFKVESVLPQGDLTLIQLTELPSKEWIVDISPEGWSSPASPVAPDTPAGTDEPNDQEAAGASNSPGLCDTIRATLRRCKDRAPGRLEPRLDESVDAPDSAATTSWMAQPKKDRKFGWNEQGEYVPIDKAEEGAQLVDGSKRHDSAQVLGDSSEVAAPNAPAQRDVEKAKRDPEDAHLLDPSSSSTSSTSKWPGGQSCCDDKGGLTDAGKKRCALAVVGMILLGIILALQNEDRCHNVHCGAHGYCSRFSGDCKCYSGYSGDRCQFSRCHNVHCGSHGSCASSSGRCVCHSGYTGQRCTIYDRCHNVRCGSHGSGSSGNCVCYSSYTGDQCQFAPAYTIAGAETPLLRTDFNGVYTRMTTQTCHGKPVYEKPGSLFHTYYRLYRAQSKWWVSPLADCDARGVIHSGYCYGDPGSCSGWQQTSGC